MSCGCGCNGKKGGCGDSAGAPSTASGVGSLIGVGQTTTTTTTTPMSTTEMLMIGIGVAALAVGGYYVYEHHKMHGGAQENPTRFKSPGAYQAAVAHILMQRYGFSAGKADQAVNDSEIGWKVAWLYQHNYNVAYATKVIHNRARKKLYNEWRSSGYMPLKKQLPSYDGEFSKPYRSQQQAAAESFYY